jgi:ammonia channel protein AmtB
LYWPSFSASDFLFCFSRACLNLLFFLFPQIFAAIAWSLLVSAVDCNIDLLDSLTLSVLVAQTARDLKKSPRKLLFKPSAAT